MARMLGRTMRSAPGEEITTVPDGARVPLTPAQARIWFSTNMFPDSSEYNAAETLSLDVSPSEERLDTALRLLIERHDALRLRFFEDNGQPVQEDSGAFDPPVVWHDLRALGPAEAALRAEEIGNASVCRLLRPDEPPLFRVLAIRLPEGRALIVLVAHHIIIDGLSAGLFLEELATLLSGGTLNSRRTTRFIDYVAWQHDQVDKRRIAKEMDYWSGKLGGELPVVDLPADRPRPTVPTRHGNAAPLIVPREVSDRLKRLADAEGTTMFVTLLAAFKVLLLRMTGQPDLIVGTALAGRDHPVTENLFGCFVKVVPLRSDLAGATSFRDAVRRVHATMVDAQDHQSIPFEQIVANLGIPRELGIHPVFQTYFGLQSIEPIRPAGAQIGRVALLGSDRAKWDLAVSLNDTPDGVDGAIEYSTDLFDADTITRLVGMYLRLLTSVSAEPERPLGEHRLICAAERVRILAGLNPYERPAHPYRTMAEPVEEQAERTPDAVALVSGEESVTYTDLNERANRLASFLRDAGAGRGTFVALCFERSIEMIVAMLAVAKAGAAYLPLDPELPDDRLAFMLGDVDPLLVLSDSRWKSRVPAGSWPVVSLDEEEHLWSGRPAANVACEGSGGHLAYLLYTSGSTGRPKAVAYPADAAITNMFAMQGSYPYEPGDATIFKTSYGFDVSIWEIFWPLFSGARVVVCRPGGHRDPSHIVELIERHGVTMVHLIPTMLQVFLDDLPAGSCRSLRWVLSAGEPITPRMRDALHARLDAQLVNGYGPTETGCATDMILPPDPGAAVPLGRPLRNFRVYLLDEDLEVVPIGTPAEAFIAAEVGLADGYFQRPDLTAAAFLPDPFGPPGARMYRSGDICRYRDDGVLEHLGRKGRQVKVAGMRIELSEVESVLHEHESVAECVVLVAEDARGKSIVAFVVPCDGTEFVASRLSSHAARMLPRHMVPASIHPVSHIPVSINGKTDHTALLAHRRADVEREIVPPAGELETRLADVFRQVLGLAELSVTDSFFTLGGHSLLIFKLISLCSEKLRVRLRVADVFAAPSVRELADRLGTSLEAPEASLVPLAPNPGKPLIVLIHAASGSALPFVDVAGRLGDDFSVFALQAPDTEANRAADTIENLAARYVEAVDGVRGLSPLILVGWSMGGCVALEMARQWRPRGVAVTGLLMLDTWVPPTVVPAVSTQARIRTAIMDLDVLAQEGLTAEEHVSAEMDRLRDVLDRNRDAFLGYSPEWFDGEVDLLYAADRVPELEAGFPDLYWAPDHGWTARVRAVVPHQVDGNHFTVVSKENAATLAETIRDIVAERITFTDI